MNEDSLKQAKVKAAKYCSYRERAPQQVLDKLRSWDLSEDEAQDVLSQLMEEKFVDESRFCRAFCHDKLELNQWGKNRISMELQKFGLSGQCVKDGLDQINAERYKAILMQLAEKKWSSMSNEQDAWKRKHKTAAYLQRKGFEGDLVWSAVGQLSVREQLT